MANWPQYLTIGWLVLAAIAGAHNGAAKYKWYANIFGEIAGTAAVFFVLWAGGFFAPLGFAP